MSGNIPHHPRSELKAVTFSPFAPVDPEQRARERAKRPSPLRVQFAEFDLPDTPANNLIKRPVTRRWTSTVFSNDSIDDEDEADDSDTDPEANSEVAEMALDDKKASSPAVPQRPSNSNASRAHHSSGISPNSRVSTMAQPNSIRRTPPAQVNRVPSALSTPRSSLALRGNHTQNLAQNISPMSSTPNRAMSAHASSLSSGPRNAPSSAGSSGRATESTRKGKQNAEGNPLSDDEDANDASPSQRASSSAGQRSGSSQGMARLSSAAGVQGMRPLSNPTPASTHRSALRLAQSTAIQRRLFTPAPEASFSGARDATQDGQTQGQIPPVQGDQAGGQGQGSHIPGGRAQGGPPQGAQAQSAHARGQPTPLMAQEARVSDGGNHSGHIQGNVTASQPQQDPAKVDSNSVNGNGKKTVPQSSPGMAVEQPRNNARPSASLERPQAPVGLNPHMFDQEPMMNPSAQQGLPAWYPAQPTSPYRMMTPMEMQYAMFQSQHMQQMQHMQNMQQMQRVFAHGMQGNAATYQPRGVGPSPTGPARPVMASGRVPSALPRPNINAVLHAQQLQGTVNAGPLSNNPSNPRGMPIAPASGPSAPRQPNVESRFRPQAAANNDSIPPQAGRAVNTTGGMTSSSNTGIGAQTSLRTQKEAKREGAIAGTKRAASSCRDGVRKKARNNDESDSDDGNEAWANYLRFKEYKLNNASNNGSQASSSRTGSASKPQKTDAQSKGRVAAAFSSQGSNVAPKAPVEQAVQSTIGGRPTIQRERQAVAVVPGVEANNIKAPQAGGGRAVYHERQQQEQSVNAHGLQRKDPCNAVTDKTNEQRMQECPAAIKPEGNVHFLIKGYEKPKTKTPPKDPSVPMGKDVFTRMPTDVRQRIYRELLKATKPITVLKGWSQVQRGQQLELHASILGVSKQHNVDANVVLYGENVLRYVLRDNAQMVEFEDGRKNKDERTLPLKKQIGNLRYLQLVVEPDRINYEASMAFYFALDLLVKNNATKLTKLTIDLSPRVQQGIPGKRGLTKDWVSQRDWFLKSQGATALIKELKPQFVSFDIHLAETNSSRAASLRTMVKLRHEISDEELLAELRTHSEHVKESWSIEARQTLARDTIEERLEAAAYKKVDMMSTRLEQAVSKGAPHMVRRGWFEEITSEGV